MYERTLPRQDNPQSSTLNTIPSGTVATKVSFFYSAIIEDSSQMRKDYTGVGRNPLLFCPREIHQKFMIKVLQT